MPLLSVITVGHETLRKRAQEVVDFSDPKIQTLIDDMISTMYEKDGIGLAAPQVDASVRIAVIVPDPTRFEEFKNKHEEALVLINPVITNHSFFREEGEEGCLSVPGFIGTVKRWKSVTVSFLNRQGEKVTMKASGLLARVFQHEIDHLDGILFIDKAEKVFKVEDPSSYAKEKRKDGLTNY